ncbi:4Fe-4S binding protein [Rhodococcus pseudokoreensis]|uniref:ferredoxin--NADP(+) reductase n=1 Tax=Rhodococcus pseudokoreensis TaxID=2811421 RepID=A0A974W3V5_9NOCA|nr:FAD-dependent oxidoreductase [Rhodococcus pseudokoreensis]QSE90773.1 4Fe-4S binding protein [Rhodococcus pseudokoreensis]
MPHVITQSCCNDAACVSACPVDCIHPSPGEPGYRTAEMLYIDPATCVDCGACVDVCPVDAISPDAALGEESRAFIELNRLHFSGRSYPRRDLPLPPAPMTVTEREPLRVAVVGAGPAAMFAVESILSRRGLEATVDVYERLPVPYGLARFGVAPDHLRTKRVIGQFERAASRRGVTFHFNTRVGRDITHEQLATSHHAVLYAVGAPSDRRLEVPGEDLPGSHPATHFVGWYNGHPDHSGHEFNLSHPRAVVIGNGNVALDVARILVSDVDSLRRTDISGRALGLLAQSAVEEVLVVGRRGVEHSAYTTKELVELDHLAGVNVLAHSRETTVDAATSVALNKHGNEQLRFKIDIAQRYAGRVRSPERKAITLRYLASPVEILGSDRVTGIRLERNEIRDDAGNHRAVGTGEIEQIDCGLVLRSIGYSGDPVPGVPFDVATRRIPNESGRVVDPRGETIPGIYTAGWIKRGPSGVIGTNKTCAAETVNAIVDDYLSGLLSTPSSPPPAVGVEAFGWDGWLAIDAYERSAGGRERPREKVVDWPKLVELATAGAAIDVPARGTDRMAPW